MKGGWTVAWAAVVALRALGGAGIAGDEDTGAAVAERDRARAESQSARDQAQAERDRALADAKAARDRARDQAHAERDRRDAEETATYDRGTADIDAGRWDSAAGAFGRVAEMNGKRADAALYWQAYALNKAGRRPEALASIRRLQATYPASRWVKDAKALEIEIGQSTGQTPKIDQEPDDDLKLMALNALMNADPERALPMVEKLLSGSASPRVRERALFVLAQSGSPQAREALARIAKGGSNPEMQRKAIEFLGLFGGAESRQVLEGVYSSATDVEVRKAVLHTYMITGQKARLLAAAREEKDPELRREAIHALGVSGGQNELWEMYKTEGAAENKKAILQALFVGGAAERIEELARSEKDPDVRRDAIRTLGLMGRERTGAALVGLYNSESDAAAKKAALQGLFIQGNAAAIIEIARKERDPQLKKEAVSHLSRMDSKEATDFMLEILNK
jgi:HEAT repeat protein